MLKMKLAAIAIAAMAGLAFGAGAEANEIEQARATVNAIERDRGGVFDEAAHFYKEMAAAQSRLRWHAGMERARAEEMNGRGCMRPPSRPAWEYCMGLYRDMVEHARWRQHLAGIVEQTKARHMAAVARLDEIDMAGQWWRTRLAALTGDNLNVAAGRPLVTGSVTQPEAARADAAATAEASRRTMDVGNQGLRPYDGYSAYPAYPVGPGEAAQWSRVAR